MYTCVMWALHIGRALNIALLTAGTLLKKYSLNLKSCIFWSLHITPEMQTIKEAIAHTHTTQNAYSVKIDNEMVSMHDDIYLPIRVKGITGDILSHLYHQQSYISQ